MNPARLHALFNAYFQPAKRAGKPSQTVSGNGKPTRYVDFDHPQIETGGLAEYFMRG